MPILNPNTKDQVDMSPIEIGTYRAKIVEAPIGTSKKDNPVVKPKFLIQVNGQERPRQPSIVSSGPGSGQFDQLLRACHFDDLADRYKQGIEEPFDTDRLVGQELMVVIDHEMYTPEVGSPRKQDRIVAFLKA